MVKIVWTDLAVNELKAIFDYISKDSKKYAANQIYRIKSRTTILKTNPLAGRIVPELEIEAIREVIEGNFRIIYRVLDEKSIEILTVHHSARDFHSTSIIV
ncbi:MAG TPA: type II toxin-antitoxin system RelE/ParE family toxin [Saprospiraceae bacterium]|nr:type II toxin-antitoxin system RelE/ParE family toxin [Saprospiraceae bacterium]MCB9327931.1 type II toxin-antitoxin system RelE/ParE family toxin [Lewinellaceae bacterium]HPK10591.1 type II toxin-antitoxin system RelE/ParE family toxin [Saprospiraceae bacterium]HPQ21051.1 type II toxin-antitoxin system RelE/ParE family toxin [Saprospiraceae bacterium]HRX29341.1 type II toxin-antitoxin system RelE/ParE family toxin [Saprospiraceae bacterium]